MMVCVICDQLATMHCRCYLSIPDSNERNMIMCDVQRSQLYCVMKLALVWVVGSSDMHVLVS